MDRGMSMKGEVLQQGEWPSLKPNASQGLATYMRFDRQSLLQQSILAKMLGKLNRVVEP